MAPAPAQPIQVNGHSHYPPSRYDASYRGTQIRKVLRDLHQSRRPNHLNQILRSVAHQASSLTELDAVTLSKIVEELDLLLFHDETSSSDVIEIVRSVRQILETWEKSEDRWVFVQDLGRAVSVRHSFWFTSKYHPSDLLSLAKFQLSDPNPYVRRGVILILSRLAVMEAGGLIIPLLKDPNHFVREVGVKAMSILSVPGTRPSLVDSLSDGNSFVRRAALRTLVIRGELTALQAKETLRRLSSTEIQSGIRSAISILLKDKAVSAKLSRDEYVARVREALRLVVFYSVQEAVPSLHFSIRSYDVPLAYEAAYAALKIGGGEATPSICRLLQDRKKSDILEQYHYDHLVMGVVGLLEHPLAEIQKASQLVLVGVGSELVRDRLSKLSRHWNRDIKKRADLSLSRLDEWLIQGPERLDHYV